MNELMYELKMDRDTSRMYYEKVKLKINQNDCYKNTFYAVSKNTEIQDNYKVAYGFVVLRVGESDLFFRHSFLIRNTDNAVLDTTSCLWNDEEVKSASYYVFKKFETVDEYLGLLLANEGKVKLKRLAIKEEVALFNELIKQGYECNPVDFSTLLNVVTGGDFSKVDDVFDEKTGCIILD